MRLNQVTVPTLDLNRSIKFYQTLGLKLIVHSSPHYARFECPQGESTFSVQLVDTLPHGDGIHVYFEIEQLDEKVEQLIAKGIPIDELPNDKRWLWREARVKDPDQNQIILFFAGTNRIHPPWRINPD